MEENIKQEELDFSAEISEQQRRILEAEADIRATDSDAITAILGYICGDIDKGVIAELYARRCLKKKGIAIANEEIVRLDSIGKVIQTLEGTGSMADPYKGWKVGMDVEQGKWYMTEDDYLWEAIKSGTPASTTDKDYFDVVGL